MEKQQIIDAVHSATADVFLTMLGLEITPMPAKTENKSPSVNEGVMSFAGLSGPWIGTGCVCCSAAFACRLCTFFLMAETTSVNEEVLDTVGELTNMIIGNFKTVAEESLGPLGLSVPTVIYGRNFTSRSLGASDWLIMPFGCG